MPDTWLAGEQGAGTSVHGIGEVLDERRASTGATRARRLQCPLRTGRRRGRSGRGSRGSCRLLRAGGLRRAADALVEQGLGRVERGARLVRLVEAKRGALLRWAFLRGSTGWQDVSDAPLVLDPGGLGGVEHAARDGDESAGEKPQVGLSKSSPSMGTVESPRTRRRTWTVRASRSFFSSKSSGRAAAVEHSLRGLYP